MKTYLSLGSNIGNRLFNLEKAVSLIKQRKLLTDVRMSIVLETTAILPNNADPTWNKPFLNMILSGNSYLEPMQLLSALKQIELDLGRDNLNVKWAPRIIDIDIILMGDKAINLENLKIPHPEIPNRPFLLHLLALLDPLAQYPNIPNDPFSNSPFISIANSIPKITDCFTKAMSLYPKLVGVINVTPDSFSDGGKNFNPDTAIKEALNMVDCGAYLIELGAQSTRPNAKIITPQEEFNRLKPVLDGLSDKMRDKILHVSIDSFSSEVILKILDNYKITWINDVSGALDGNTLSLIAQAGCEIVTMHALSVPVKVGVHLPAKANPILVYNEWAEHILDHLIKHGFKTNSIILDPGIGFGKSPYQSICLLKNIDKLKRFGCRLLVGHSRKSYISGFSRTEPGNRDIETVSISEHLASHNVDYLRVHDVANHQRFFVGRQIMHDL